ncbi:hypothetical protein ACWCPD_41040, partial [Streptomyces sp. NPDC001935]
MDLDLTLCSVGDRVDVFDFDVQLRVWVGGLVSGGRVGGQAVVGSVVGVVGGVVGPVVVVVKVVWLFWVPVISMVVVVLLS